MSSNPRPVDRPPRGTRHQAVREFKRALIRDAAKTIFTARGIEAASMREIAKAAGYTTGTIYTYFATKEDLYAEILRDTLHAQYDAIVQASGAATGSRAVAALRRLWEFYQENPADFDLGFYLYGGARRAGLSRELDDELNALLDRVMTHVGECLVADGVVRPEEAHHRAVMHVTSIFGLLLMVKTGRLKSVKEEAGPMLESFLRTATHKDQ